MATAHKLVALYPWYKLPASVHKILIHAAEVIDNALLGIGKLSEEAAEANNKNIKMYRRCYTRKMTRKITNEDLIKRLLLQSDPYISNILSCPKVKTSVPSKDLLELLIL